MEIEGGEGQEATPVDHALDALSTALDHLVKVVEDGGLDGYDQTGLLGFARSFEQVRQTDRAGRPPARPRPRGAAGGGDARAAQHRRAAGVAAAHLPRRGQPAGPGRGAAGGAGHHDRRTPATTPPGAGRGGSGTGDAGPEQVDICLRALAGVDHRGFDPADLDAADGLLAGFAATFAPAELREVAARVVDRIDPDGTLPPEQLNTDRRHLALRTTRDGMWPVEGRLTGAVGAKLRAVLSPLAAPRPQTVVLEDGREVSEPDPRHHGQRMHDALEEVCDRLLRSGTLPDTGGTPDHRHPHHPRGRPRRPSPVGRHQRRHRPLRRHRGRTLADEAEVWPTVVDSRGVVLRMGRTRRLATPGQTVALIARDGGCSFPGCQRPPEWCERHHVVAWVDGGPTDLDNLTLLCAYHHHNFAGRGWTCRIIDGLPAWTPPKWVDPQQRPLTNTRITARRHPERLRC